MLAAVILRYTVFVCMIGQYKAFIKYKINPAPDGHRLVRLSDNPNMGPCPTTYLISIMLYQCGICPTYHQKMCAFDFKSNETFIFDNHCIMDLYNCMHGTNFAPMYYEECLYFGNFAYVHGIRYEDEDYGEDHIKIMGAKKNPDFV